jgi:hypothetical protein
MKAFVHHTMDLAAGLRDALERLDADHRVALMHYSPIPDTLQGERPEIYPFLGSYLLAEPSTRPAPTSSSTATRTAAPRRATHPGASTSATSRSR